MYVCVYVYKWTGFPVIFWRCFISSFKIFFVHMPLLQTFEIYLLKASYIFRCLTCPLNASYDTLYTITEFSHQKIISNLYSEIPTHHPSSDSFRPPRSLSLSLTWKSNRKKIIISTYVWSVKCILRPASQRYSNENQKQISTWQSWVIHSLWS